MTYCCGLLVRDGLVMIGDTRTNAGLDNVSTFRKLHVLSRPGERVIGLASAGNLSVSQTVLNLEQLVLLAGARLGNGNSLANLIVGNAADNIIDGAFGADTMVGGSGDDTYYVDNAGDIITEYAHEGLDSVIASTSYALGAQIEKLTLVSGAISGTGNGLDNVIVGNNLDNIIDGGAGADTMVGGSGSDLYVVDNVGDVISETSDGGNDTVVAFVSYGLTANVENIVLSGTNSINAWGNDLDNRLTGNSGDNSLDGKGGYDTVDYSATTQGVTVDLFAGFGSGSGIGYDRLYNIENIIGGSGADLLTGDLGANVIDGRGGGDTLIGLGGDDVYVVHDANDVVVEYANEGNDLISSYVSLILPANIESLRLMEGAGDLWGVGNDANNTLYGNSGNNIFDGGRGDDVMVGGAGNDTYTVDSTGDSVIENAGEGYDVVYAFVDYAVPNNVEVVVMMGSARNINFDGGPVNGSADLLAAADSETQSHSAYGNAMANQMIGSVGADTFFAGDGSDYLYGNAGNDVLVANSIENLFAHEADTLLGGDGNDTLYGDAFDTLDGGAGFDVLQVINAYDMHLDVAAAHLEYVVSDFGNDTYTAATGTTAVEIYGSGGNDTITGGFGNDRLWGGIDNDVLIGNDGNDVLVGDLGADMLWGGAGNDRLYVDAADTLIDAGEGYDVAYIIGGDGISLDMAASSLEWVADFANGNDVIDASGCSVGVQMYSAGGNDHLTGGSDADQMFAGAGDDVLVGGDGNDLLVGETGADSLYGGAGDDCLYIDSSDTVIDGGEGTDTAYIAGGSGIAIDMADCRLESIIDVVGGNDTIDASRSDVGVSVAAGAGADTIVGSSHDDTLAGGAGDDTIHGGSGADRIIGGGGFDLLFGGDDADTFVYSTAGGTGTIADWLDGVDTIEFDHVPGLNGFSDLTIVDSAGNAELYFGDQKLFVVVGAAGHIDSHDLLFV